MIRITLMDGSAQEISREETRGLIAWRAPLTNPQLKAHGVIFHGGTVLPVYGPLAYDAAGSVSERPWLLVLKDRVQVIRGLPTFDDDISLGIVPERTRPAPTLVKMPEPTEEALLTSPAAPAAEASALTRSEEEEEAQVLQELEELLRAS
jgi:hypothetical protein